MAIFRSKRDIAFFERIASELIEKVVGEKFTYYPISLKLSQTDFYGETKEKIVDPPVNMYGIINWGKQDIKTTEFGQDIVYNISIFVLENYLVRVSVKPKEGDMIEYDNRFFEITKIEEPRQIFGKAGNKMGYTLTCKTVRESNFKISISGTIDNQARTVPDDRARITNFYDNITYPFSGSS